MSELPQFTLTKRQLQILQLMDSTDDELVYERGIGYVGTRRVHWRTLQGLLRVAAISMDQYSQVGGFERYHINETGRDLLAIAQKARGTTAE